MSFKLLDNRIAVTPDPDEETTKGGLVLLPDSNAREVMRYGTVHTVGNGRRSDHTGELIPMDVAVGDRVFWNRHSGSPITIDDEEVICLGSGEIVGIVE